MSRISYKKICYCVFTILIILPFLFACNQKKNIDESNTTNEKDDSKSIEDIYEFPEITIDFKEFPVEIIGYDGYGVVQNRLNLLEEKKLNEMIGSDELNELQKKLFLEDNTKEDRRYTTVRDYSSTLAHFIDDFKVSIDKPTFLKNGDVVTITIEYDKSVTEEFKNIHIKNDKIKITVQDLKTPYKTLNDVPESLKNDLKKQADIFGEQYMQESLANGMYDGYTYKGLEVSKIEWSNQIDHFIENKNDRGDPFIYHISNTKFNNENIDDKYYNMELLQCYEITYTIKLSNNSYKPTNPNTFDGTLIMTIYKFDEFEHYENWIFDRFWHHN